MLFLYRGDNHPTVAFSTNWEAMQYLGRPLMAIHQHLRTRGSIIVDDTARLGVLLKAKGKRLPEKAVRFAQTTLTHGRRFY